MPFVGPFARPEAAPEAEPVAEVDTREAFVDLYERTHADMVRLAFLITGSAETAQDLVQDSFVRLHQAWRRVREPEWYLRRSVVNACNSHHRRVARHRKLPTERPRVSNLEADEISDALMQLPARQRSAIVLRYWHDCSKDQIAAALGCRPGTVSSLLHRGLAQLRGVIEI